MKKIILLIIKILITGSILWVIFSRIPIKNVFSTLSSAKPYFILCVVLLTLIERFFEGIQMHILTKHQGITLSLMSVIEVGLVATFYGLFLPGYLAGGVIRWYKISAHDKKPAEAFAAIIFNRFIITSLIVIIGLNFFVLDSVGVQQHYFGVILLIVFIACILVYCVILNSSLMNFVASYLSRENIAFVPHFIQKNIQKVVNSFARFCDLSLKERATIIICALLSQALGLFAFYLLVLSLSITSLNIINVGWIRTLIFLITLVPISLSGVGLREGGLLIILQPYHVESSACVALSLLIFLQLLFLGIIGGILEARNMIFKSKYKS